MEKLKLTVIQKRGPEAVEPCSCGPSCAPEQGGAAPEWITGTLSTPAGSVPTISPELSSSDLWEHVKCRTSSFRTRYTVAPGLYAVGNPVADSDVFVSANYKLSFDALRSSLAGLDAWLLVLDTKGINVWCAAGKGTFGTDELIRRITQTCLEKVVSHKRIIVPQLGAPGVSAHVVRQKTGFRVHYGPVRAKDIPAYCAGGYKATREMRTVKFPLMDRLVLTPMEINPAMEKFPLYALIVLLVFGLQPAGVIFRDAFYGGLSFIILGLIAVLAGAFVTPLLLPFVPFRSFALKGWIMGMLATFLPVQYAGLVGQPDTLLRIAAYAFFPMLSSYIALQFTGSTTFTGMSGVKKELKIALPVYAVFGGISLLLILAYKLQQWRMI